LPAGGLVNSGSEGRERAGEGRKEGFEIYFGTKMIKPTPLA